MFEWWNQTITICNKLSGKDSATGLDTWKKTVLHNCFFKQETIRNITGTSVSVGNTVIARIPENPDYKPYSIWKNDISDGFTLSVGDYIFLGELEDEITASNIVTLFNSKKPHSFLVRAVSDNSNFGILNHYKAEGV